MKPDILKLTIGLIFTGNLLFAQQVKLTKNTLQPFQVSASFEKLMGKDVVKVVKDSAIQAVDEPTFVK